MLLSNETKDNFPEVEGVYLFSFDMPELAEGEYMMLWNPRD